MNEKKMTELFFMNNIGTYVDRGVSDRFRIRISMSDNKCEDQTKSRKNAFSINLSVVITKKNVNFSEMFFGRYLGDGIFQHPETSVSYFSYFTRRLMS